MTKKKKSTTKIPTHTTASFVRENNHLLWEIREHTANFSRDSRMITSELWSMLADVYCYGDDLRQYAYKFIQDPLDQKSKMKLIDHIGEFNKFNNKMKTLDQMIAGDEGKFVKKEESNRKDIN